MKPDPEDHALDHPLPTSAGSYVVQPDNTLLQVEAATQSPDPNAPDAFQGQIEAVAEEAVAEVSQDVVVEKPVAVPARPPKVGPVDRPDAPTDDPVKAQEKEA